MEVVTLKDQEARLIKRKKELGWLDNDGNLTEFGRKKQEAARNNGSKRTPEKRAMLKFIKEEARRQGREPTFKANY